MVQWPRPVARSLCADHQSRGAGARSKNPATWHRPSDRPLLRLAASPVAPTARGTVRFVHQRPSHLSVNASNTSDRLLYWPRTSQELTQTGSPPTRWIVARVAGRASRRPEAVAASSGVRVSWRGQRRGQRKPRVRWRPRLMSHQGRRFILPAIAKVHQGRGLAARTSGVLTMHATSRSRASTRPTVGMNEAAGVEGGRWTDGQLRAGLPGDRAGAGCCGRRQGGEPRGALAHRRHPRTAWLLCDDGCVPANHGGSAVNRLPVGSAVAPEPG